MTHSTDVTENSTTQFDLVPDHPQRLAALCGLANEHLKLIESRLDIRVANRGNHFELSGEPRQIHTATDIIRRLYRETKGGKDLSPEMVHLFLQPSEVASIKAPKSTKLHEDKLYVVHTPKLVVKPRGTDRKSVV